MIFFVNNNIEQLTVTQLPTRLSGLSAEGSNGTGNDSAQNEERACTETDNEGDVEVGFHHIHTSMVHFSVHGTLGMIEFSSETDSFALNSAVQLRLGERGGSVTHMKDNGILHAIQKVESVWAGLLVSVDFNMDPIRLPLRGRRAASESDLVLLRESTSRCTEEVRSREDMSSRIAHLSSGEVLSGDHDGSLLFSVGEVVVTGTHVVEDTLLGNSDRGELNICVLDTVNSQTIELDVGQTKERAIVDVSDGVVLSQSAKCL